MAQALRTVWLEPEEQQESLTPQLQPRRRRRAVPTSRQQLPVTVAKMVGIVALVVGFFLAYINSYTRIAHYEFQRQAAAAELQQLQNDCTQLNLQIAQLRTSNRIIQVAKSQQLEYPSPDRVHYIRVASDFPQPVAARTTPDGGRHTWLASAGHQMIARLGTVFQRLSRGPGTPAYAQD